MCGGPESARMLVNSPGLLIWTGTPSTTPSPDPCTEPCGGCRKESCRPPGVPGGALNLESKSAVGEFRKSHRQVTIRFLLVPLPWGHSSNSKVSGETLPGKGSFAGGKALLLLPWETSREPRGRSYCWYARLHYARIGGRGATKQVCWRSGGGVLLGPVSWRP